jgi:hypothetical protein
MRKRRWQVEWRTQAREDGLDRLRQMVQLVIDHAVVDAQAEPTKPLPPLRRRDCDDEQSEERPL